MGKPTIIHNAWDEDVSGWNFRSSQPEDRYDFRKAVRASRVVGNIFEHPNLLT